MVNTDKEFEITGSSLYHGLWLYTFSLHKSRWHI